MCCYFINNVLLFYKLGIRENTLNSAAHLLVLIDEASQRGVLVANLPPQINDDGHEHQHHNNHGGGEGYTEDDVNFHMLCVLISHGKGTAWRKSNSPTVGKQSPISGKSDFQAVSKREKGVWNETTRHLFTDGMGLIFLSVRKSSNKPAFLSFTRNFTVVGRRHGINFAEDTEK